MSGKLDDLDRARHECEDARRRVMDTLGEIKHRLSPRSLAGDAWDGVREKSGAVADDALQAVKDRPVAVSGVLAAIVLVLARDPLRRMAAGFLSRRNDEGDTGTIEAKLEHDENYDLTAPTVERSRPEGVNA